MLGKYLADCEDCVRRSCVFTAAGGSERERVALLFDRRHALTTPNLGHTRDPTTLVPVRHF
jgi:hypothetical protein